MTTKGIRGAISVSENTPEAIKEATLELLKEMVIGITNAKSCVIIAEGKS